MAFRRRRSFRGRRRYGRRRSFNARTIRRLRRTSGRVGYRL